MMFCEDTKLAGKMAQINQTELKYRQMLTQLDKLLTDRELSTLKFQSKPYGIGDRERGKISSSLELWEKLEERGHLNMSNLANLKELLKHSTDNRQDVLIVVEQFEKFRHVPDVGQSGEGN